MSTIQITENPLSLNKILLDTLGGAMRKVLETCAQRINDNFDTLSTLDSDDRLEAIVRIFGLDDEDTVKIIKPAKKASDPTKKAGKAKTEKKIPVPFWIYKVPGTNAVKSTVNPDLCQGLMAGLYNQCTSKPKSGCVYCNKCQKDADSNGGIPKRGNVALRAEQFNQSAYKYTPPSGPVKKIYPLDWALKHKFTEENFDEMLTENGIRLTEQGKKVIKFVPEKKTRAPKKEKLTEDMKKKKNEDKEPKSELMEEETNDDDDTASVAYSEAPSEFDDDLPEVEFPEEEEEEIIQPKHKAKVVEEPIDISQFKTINLGESGRYATLKTSDKNKPFDLYELSEFKTAKDFKIKSRTPIKRYDPESGELEDL